ncbi:MAG: bis(5'-nucleosyl)-tetraphosphatase (symmetrical) YqeK [Leptolyngbyaceae cyanobacterium MO_188.B28]|nr:bis(5'-nucleosyl)-tetraphosphatase (symmetrical) YqeK [Leptolyngbyaceae cyanobacterium MO_188.B28]
MSESSEKLRQRVLNWLEDNVPIARLDHILRVEQMAIALAQHHDVEPELAAQAGLMHDLAKCFKPKQLLKMAKAEGLALDPVDEAAPHLLHAEVGAIVARDTFGVDNTPVLDAIRNHTLGRPGMSNLSCVVFLADCLEPGRGNTQELNRLRQLSYDSLFAAVDYTCEYSLRRLLENRRLIHPRTILTRNWFLESSRSQSQDLLRSGSTAVV